MEGTGRERILSQIRRSLGRGPLHGEAKDRALERLHIPRANLRPKRTEIGAEERLRLFVELVERQAMTTERVSSMTEVPAAIARKLGERSIQSRVKVAPHPGLSILDWRTVGLNAEVGKAAASDDVGVSVAFCGIAETGSIMFLSGSDTPIALCFLPPAHMIVLRTSDIVPTLEDAWARVRHHYGARAMPRTSLIVSGTSATGDVGQVIVRGASGPLEVHVLLLETS